MEWDKSEFKKIIAITQEDFDFIDKERAEKAALSMDKLRKVNAFSSGKEKINMCRHARKKGKSITQRLLAAL